jgi:hypothetical protein
MIEKDYRQNVTCNCCKLYALASLPYTAVQSTMPDLARKPSSSSKHKRDVKGKGKAQPAIRGRGVQARQVRRQTYEAELKELDERLAELVGVIYDLVALLWTHTDAPAVVG